MPPLAKTCAFSCASASTAGDSDAQVRGLHRAAIWRVRPAAAGLRSTYDDALADPALVLVLGGAGLLVVLRRAGPGPGPKVWIATERDALGVRSSMRIDPRSENGRRSRGRPRNRVNLTKGSCRGERAVRHEASIVRLRRNPVVLERYHDTSFKNLSPAFGQVARRGCGRGVDRRRRGRERLASEHAGHAELRSSTQPVQIVPSFADVIDRVKPAVVSVRVKVQNVASRSDSDSEDDNGGQQFSMPDLPPGARSSVSSASSATSSRASSAASGPASSTARPRARASSSPATAMSSPTTTWSRMPSRSRSIMDEAGPSMPRSSARIPRPTWRSSRSRAARLPLRAASPRRKRASAIG